MSERVSNERLAEIVTELQDEDRRAQASGATHGNYGEDFGALVLDLRDARAALVRLGYAEDANRQLEIARERIAEVERERDEWRLAVGAEAEAYDAENERFKKRGGELDALDAEVARLKAECDDGRCPSAQHERLAAEQAIARLKAERRALVEAGVRAGRMYADDIDDEASREGYYASGYDEAAAVCKVAARVLAEFDKEGASDG